MVNKKLLKRLGKLGYPLFETEEAQDANATLAEVVQTEDLRLWEGFSVVLATSTERGLFDYEMVKSKLKKPFDKANFDTLFVLSLALYKALNLKFSWADEFYEHLSMDEKKEFNGFLENFKKNREFKVSKYLMSSQRLKATFNNYVKQETSRLNDLVSVKQELGLEYALSQVFSPKQKELFLKKLRREKMTKTEKEYFSRVVKKKVLALANPELHHLAQRLV